MVTGTEPSKLSSMHLHCGRAIKISIQMSKGKPNSFVESLAAPSKDEVYYKKLMEVLVECASLVRMCTCVYMVIHVYICMCASKRLERACACVRL